MVTTAGGFFLHTSGCVESVDARILAIQDGTEETTDKRVSRENGRFEQGTSRDQTICTPRETCAPGINVQATIIIGIRIDRS